VQLVAGLAHAVAVVGVDDEDEALRVLEVVAPERADLFLSFLVLVLEKRAKGGRRVRERRRGRKREACAAAASPFAGSKGPRREASLWKARGRREGGRKGGELCPLSLLPLSSFPRILFSHLVLASHVPHGERDVLVLDGLDVEACRERRGSERKRKCVSARGRGSA
jgi:hypothetical protein